MDELRSEWQDLADDAISATPFQTWEWQSSWLRHFRRAKRPLIIAVREGRDLVGLMPLTRSSGPWRTVRAMGSGASDYLHPLARVGYEEAVAEEVSGVLRDMAGVDLVDLHQVREDRAFSSHGPAAKRLTQATCLVLDLPPTFEQYLASLGKSLRYDVRKLSKLEDVTVEPVEASEVGRGLDILFDQHRMRWRKRGLPGAFLGRAQGFHREWAGQAIERGWLWLSILRRRGEPIGAIYAMRKDETCYFYQAGFDPAHAAISPGTLLVAATIKRAIEEGVKQFDFLRGDEPYKRRWKPQRELKNYRLIQPRNVHLGSLGAGWNEAGSRVEARLRARLEGKSLL